MEGVEAFFDHNNKDTHGHCLGSLAVHDDLDIVNPDKWPEPPILGKWNRRQLKQDELKAKKLKINEDGYYVIPGRWITRNMELCVKENEWYWRDIKTGEKYEKFSSISIIATFSYFSHEWASYSIARTLLSTPLSAGMRVFRYMTGEVSQGVVESLNTFEEIKLSRPPQKMWELFNIIGSECEPICKGVAGYPDSVYLRLDVKNEVEVYYGYER